MISVTVCTHNRLAYLKSALASVYRQSFRDFEVVVVDDGSTDATAAWIRARRFPRLRFFRFERNRGLAAARNESLREARGDLIAFLDSDDLYYPAYLGRMAAAFDDPRIMVAASHSDKIDGEGRTVPRAAAARRESRLAWFRDATGLPFPVGFSMVMLRKRIFSEVGAFDEGFHMVGEDIDLLYRVGLRFGKEAFRYIEEPLMAHREHGGARMTDSWRRHAAVGPGARRRRAPLTGLSALEEKSAVDLAYFGVKHGLRAAEGGK
ncbi:MAG: glycosyltransferase family 2 protein [Elusimicrobiota bacterium]